jgi:hypothetical protein
LPHTKSETTEGIEQKELHDDGLEEKQLNGGDTDEGLKKGMTVKRDDAKKDDSKKHTHRELVAILAYLELKKRLRKDEPKFGSKYIELKNRGSTVIRVKGRNVRVKLPVCKAFKKDADKEDEVQTHSLVSLSSTSSPSQLCVHITPAANRDFIMVQQAAHNPRIKLQVPLAKGLSSVISYLESKWATKQSEKHLCLLVPPAMPPSNEMTASKSTEIEVDCAGQLEKREWTKTSAGNVTVGDVFKCLGRPKKFCLSYTWIDKKQEVFESKPFPALTHLIDLLVAAGQEQEARVVRL